jgi:hypothetical protein
VITFDKLKIVSDISAIDIHDISRFDIITKNGVVTALKYYQELPYLLMIKVDYQSREVVVEFSGKVLGKDYPKLISISTIAKCFENINALGFCSLDVETMMDSDVVKCDVTKDVKIQDVSGLTQYIRNHISNYQQFLCRKLRNGNLVVDKNVVSRKTKKRMIIYDKEKEMHRAENEAFVEANGLEGAFDGMCRFEINLDSKEQIRQALHVHNTKLMTVLSADANPIADYLDNVVQSPIEDISIPDKKTYMMTLVLKDCDYDLEKVEAKLRSFINSRGTSIRNIMKPYIALMDQMNNKGGADLWQDTRRKLS